MRLGITAIPIRNSRSWKEYGSSPLRSRHCRTADPTPANDAAAQSSPSVEQAYKSDKDIWAEAECSIGEERDGADCGRGQERRVDEDGLEPTRRAWSGEDGLDAPEQVDAPFSGESAPSEPFPK